MMTHIRKSVSVLFWALLFITCLSSNAQVLEPGQIYTTNNVVIPTTTSSGSTWTGAVYQDSLTCWMSGDPGYCGPNAIVRPGGNFNFSYGSTYVYQEQQASTIFSGVTAAGLKVNGYNFSFTAKNGNGWDDGRVDQLTALVRFWDTTGSKGAGNLLYGNSYNLSSRYNWTNFNYSENFTTPLNVTDIGKVQYGFIGKDNNGWAGPYGPEIHSVNFNLKYSVDPCAVDPRSSPTCPGYLSYIMSLMPASTTSAASASTVVTTSTPESTGSVTPSTVEQPTQQSNPTTPTATASITSTPSASTQGTATQSMQENTRSTNGTSIGLSVIAKNKEKETAIANQAVSAAVSLAVSAGQAAQEQSVAVATTQAQQSVALTDSIAASTNNLYSLSSQQMSSTGLNVQLISGPQVQSTTVLPSIAVEEPNQSLSAFKLQENNQSNTQQIEFYQLQSNMLLDKTNPLNSVIDSQITVDTQSQQSTSTVKKDVPNNELAGGVGISNIALLPTGYNAYLNLVMKDAAFYASRDIYPTQQNVDNGRALRQLSSDRLHQEMVNQQYRK